MEDFVHFTLYQFLTSANLQGVKRTSTTDWANVLLIFLQQKDLVPVSEKNLKKNYQYLANFFRRKSRKRSTESLREEYKENFTDQILIGRPVSTIDDLLYRFDSISICNEEEDSKTVICRICRKTEILVTRKFCAKCLNTAISDAILKIKQNMEEEQNCKKTRKRKLSETFQEQTKKTIKPDTSFLPLKPQYHIPKKETEEIFCDDLDFKYIEALSSLLPGKSENQNTNEDIEEMFCDDLDYLYIRTLTEHLRYASY